MDYINSNTSKSKRLSRELNHSLNTISKKSREKVNILCVSGNPFIKSPLNPEHYSRHEGVYLSTLVSYKTHHDKEMKPLLKVNSKFTFKWARCKVIEIGRKGFRFVNFMTHNSNCYMSWSYYKTTKSYFTKQTITQNAFL